MVPAWRLVDPTNNTWKPCWLISTTTHGNGQPLVLIAFDDKAHPSWGYPDSSLRIESVNITEVRIRRTMIPLLENPDGD